MWFDTSRFTDRCNDIDKQQQIQGKVIDKMNCKIKVREKS